MADRIRDCHCVCLGPGYLPTGGLALEILCHQHECWNYPIPWMTISSYFTAIGRGSYCSKRLHEYKEWPFHPCILFPRIFLDVQRVSMISLGSQHCISSALPPVRFFKLSLGSRLICLFRLLTSSLMNIYCSSCSVIDALLGASLFSLLFLCGGFGGRLDSFRG